MRVRPTAFGAKMLAFYLVNVVAFLATAYSNLFFLLLAFLGLLIVVGAWWSVRNLRALSVSTLSGEEPASPLEPSSLILELEAPRVQVHGVVLEVRLASGRKHALTLGSVRGRARVSRSLEGVPRGIHLVQRVLVTSSFPFGVWRVVRELPCEGLELVHPPRPRSFAAPAERTAFLSEMGGSLASGHGEIPAGLRPFREGDEPRRIAWRASARRGQSVVLDMEEERQEGFAIVLDRRAPSEVFERALEEIAVLVDMARREKVRVSFRTQEKDIQCGEGARPHRELSRLLAELQGLPLEDRRNPTRSEPHAVLFPREETRP